MIMLKNWKNRLVLYQWFVYGWCISYLLLIIMMIMMMTMIKIIVIKIIMLLVDSFTLKYSWTLLFIQVFWDFSFIISQWDENSLPLSTYAKFSEKLTFLTLWYAHVRVCIRGLEMLVFRKILRAYLMDDSKGNRPGK